MPTQRHAVPDPERETDLIFDILSSPRRRYLVEALHAADRPVATVTGIADEVAALEYGVPVEEVSQVERKRVYVSLYQTHLPKLEETGILSFDRQAGTIKLTNSAERVGSYLDVPITVTPIHHIYLLFGILSAFFLTLVYLDLPLFGAIPDAVAGFLVVVGLVVLSVAVTVLSDSSLRLPDSDAADSLEDGSLE